VIYQRGRTWVSLNNNRLPTLIHGNKNLIILQLLKAMKLVIMQPGIHVFVSIRASCILRGRECHVLGCQWANGPESCIGPPLSQPLEDAHTDHKRSEEWSTWE
jgi:hypothetical protein